jgi:hypothetical protein
MQDNKNICIVSPLQEEPINFNDEIVGLCKVICFQSRQIYQNMCTWVMFYKNASLWPTQQSILLYKLETCNMLTHFIQAKPEHLQ